MQKRKMKPVELTTYWPLWLAHTVYKTKGLVPANGWSCLIALGLVGKKVLPTGLHKSRD